MPPKKGAKAGAAKKGAVKGKRNLINWYWCLGEGEENEYQEVPVTTEPVQVAQSDQV